MRARCPWVLLRNPWVASTRERRRSIFAHPERGHFQSPRLPSAAAGTGAAPGRARLAKTALCLWSTLAQLPRRRLANIHSPAPPRRLRRVLAVLGLSRLTRQVVPIDQKGNRMRRRLTMVLALALPAGGVSVAACAQPSAARRRVGTASAAARSCRSRLLRAAGASAARRCRRSGGAHGAGAAAPAATACRRPPRASRHGRRHLLGAPPRSRAARRRAEGPDPAQPHPPRAPLRHHPRRRRRGLARRGRVQERDVERVPARRGRSSSSTEPGPVQPPGRHGRARRIRRRSRSSTARCRRATTPSRWS